MLKRTQHTPSWLEEEKLRSWGPSTMAQQTLPLEGQGGW